MQSLDLFRSMLNGYWSETDLAVNLVILLHLLGAVLLGALTGYERTFHGRAAGIRTYSLVCMASAALMVINAHPELWYGQGEGLRVALDPTRVVQGIMTGIGFLGAGVIVREGLSIRGLSTAASIWATAAIGIMIGVGFYLAAITAALLVVAIMSGVRTLEDRLPRYGVVRLRARFTREAVPSEGAVRELVERHGFVVRSIAYEMRHARTFEYRLSLSTRHPERGSALATALAAIPELVAFDLSPARE